MCGLIATITSDTYATNLDDWFKDAFYASLVRGTDSAGMFQLKKNNQLSLVKRASNAANFVNISEVRGLLADVPRVPLSVGHVRAATQGSIRDDNAHPFIHIRQDGSKVIGVHNGTLRGWKDKEGGKEHEVDSKWAFDRLGIDGPIDAFEYFNGPFAFIWHDTRFPDHVWMTRNDDRPLHFFKSEDGKTLMFCSELGMLGWLAERNGFAKKKDEQAFFFLDPSNIYKFSLKEVGKYELIARPKYDPTTTPQKPAAEPAAHTNMVPWRDNRSHFRYSSTDYYEDNIPFGSTTNSGGDSYDQKYTLGKVKEALAKARSIIHENATRGGKTESDDAENEIVTADDLDRQMERTVLGKALAEEIATFKSSKEFDAWALVGGTYFIEEPNTRTATSQEIALAKEDKLMGLAVAFNGILYDDENGDLYGDAYVQLNGKTEQFDCIMRGLSKAAADVQYIDVNSPVPVAVIGETRDVMPGKIAFIVSSLKKETKAQLARKIADEQQSRSTSIH